MLAVNLDLPLMFLLLDGSLVNFHGGRMTFDQAKMRFRQLQRRPDRGAVESDLRMAHPPQTHAGLSGL